MSDFGTRLRQLREAQRLSVAELAKAAGIERTAIHRLESGGRQPNWITLVALAKGLGASLGDFDTSTDQKIIPRISRKKLKSC